MSEETKIKNGFGCYEGVIVDVMPEMKVGSTGFRKREIVLEDDPTSQYRHPIKFTFKKDRCDLVAAFENAKGHRVRVNYVIDGRRWDGPRGTQYFVDLTGLGIETLNAPAGDSSSVANDRGVATMASGSDVSADDFPF